MSEIVKKNQAELTDQVLAKVKNFEAIGELVLPPDYNAANALKSAGLMLADMEVKQKNGKWLPVLEACSKESIGNALLKMVVQGLSPIKDQCSLIAYNGKLSCDRTYKGSIVIAKRVGGVKHVTAQAVFEADEFEYKIEPRSGLKEVTLHKQKLGNQKTPVAGAYCIVEFNDGRIQTEVMDIEQIENSWNQRKGEGLSPAHKNFADEMAKKTCINRALKPIIDSADDSEILKNIPVVEKDIPKSVLKEEIKESEKKSEFVDFEVIPEKEEIIQEPPQIDPDSDEDPF